MPKSVLHFALVFVLAICELGQPTFARDALYNEPLENAQPVVVTHNSVDTSSLSINQLRSIFSLRVRNWPDGSPIRVVVLEEQNPVTLSFVRESLKMLPHQLRRQWDRIIYSGLGQGPLIV